MVSGRIQYKPNPRFHADAIPVYFGSSQDSRIIYDATNDEFTVQTKDAGGTFQDRIRVEANTNTPDADLVDVPLKWTAGRAVTAGDYSISRDADATNQMHLNVPTGAGFELSINDAAEVKYTTGAMAFQQTTTISTTTGDLKVSAAAGADVLIGDDVTLLYVDGGLGAIGINVAAEGARLVSIGGSFTGSGNVYGLAFEPTLTPTTSGNAYGYRVFPTLNGVSGQTHDLFAGANYRAPTVNLNGGTVTKAVTLYVDGAPTGAGTNLGVEVAGGAKVLLSGELEVDGNLNHDGSNAGLYGVTPVAQAAKINDPSGGATVDSEARTAINAIIDALEGIGITASV